MESCASPTPTVTKGLFTNCGKASLSWVQNTLPWCLERRLIHGKIWSELSRQFTSVLGSSSSVGRWHVELSFRTMTQLSSQFSTVHRQHLELLLLVLMSLPCKIWVLVCFLTLPMLYWSRRYFLLETHTCKEFWIFIIRARSWYYHRYCASRTLYSLALDGHAPKFLRKCTKKGVPIWCFCITMIFPFLSFLAVGTSSAQVITW